MRHNNVGDVPTILVYCTVYRVPYAVPHVQTTLGFATDSREFARVRESSREFARVRKSSRKFAKDAWTDSQRIYGGFAD